jgi:hypothetical protein
MMHPGDWQRSVDYHQRMIDQRDTEIAGIDAVLGPKPVADAHKGDWQIYLDRRQRRRRAVADRADHQQRLDRLLANPPQPAQQEAA